MLDNIRIVLSHTSHPGNIGACARAMKNMGCKNLYLVNPKVFPSFDATARASGADDILVNAKVVKTLLEAIAGVNLIIGVSSRQRALSLTMIDPKNMALTVAKQIAETNAKTAIIFGCEQSGLSNFELNQCQIHVNIPANPEYQSLNLAQAVQIICYELFQVSFHKFESIHINAQPLANGKELALFYQHLEKTLIELEFLNPDNPKQLMTRLKRLFNRTKMEQIEVNILRGILAAAQKKVNLLKEVIK